MSEYYLRIIENAEKESALRKMNSELFGIRESENNELFEKHQKKYLSLTKEGTVKNLTESQEELLPASCNFTKSKHLLYLKESLKN